MRRAGENRPRRRARDREGGVGVRDTRLAHLEIAAKLAEVWGVPLEEVGRRTSANAAALYRWP